MSNILYEKHLTCSVPHELEILASAVPTVSVLFVGCIKSVAGLAFYPKSSLE